MSDPTPLRVLVADDSPDNQLLVKTFLRAAPVALTQVSDGRQAVDRFFAGTFDLVLMDMEMPVLDGYEATREIREREKAEGREPCPILAMTAHDQGPELERTREAGCDGRLAKPLTMAGLMACLQRARPRS